MTSYHHSQTSKFNDLVLVNVGIFDKDNKLIRKELRQYKNYRRDWYYVKPAYQDYAQRKLEMPLSKLDQFKSTQRGMMADIKRQIRTSDWGMRKLGNDVFLFGTDIHVESVIKQKFVDKYGDIPYLPITGFMDYEWDVDTNELTFGTYAIEDHLYITVRKDIVKDYPNYKELLQQEVDGTISETLAALFLKRNLKRIREIDKDIHAKALNDVLHMKDKLAAIDVLIAMNIKGFVAVQPRKYKLHVMLVDRPSDVAVKLIEQTHVDKPDFLAFWAGDNDWEIIEENCARDGVDMASFVSDPSIPDEFKHYKFIRDNYIHVSSSGTKMAPKWYEKHHKISAPTSWTYVQMEFAHQLSRGHLPQRASYGLDNILSEDIGFGKLKYKGKFDGYEQMTKKRWFRTMQDKHPVEFGGYALWDNIGPQILEDWGLEISCKLYPALGVSGWDSIKKNPRRLYDVAHFTALKRKTVMGVSSESIRSPVHDRLQGSSGLIITLPSDTHTEMGSLVMEGNSDETMAIVQQAKDDDLVSSYPKNQMGLNVSMPTTAVELLEVDGMPQEDMVTLAIGFTAGNYSNLQYARKILDYPNLKEWDNILKDDIAKLK